MNDSMIQPRFKSIELGEFKAFREATLPIKPLTVVFGRNGSGKSVLVRLPLLLAAALRPMPGQHPGLPLEVGALRFGTSLRSFRRGGDPDEYSLSLEIDGHTPYRLDVVMGKEPRSSVTSPGQWVKKWVLSDHRFDWTGTSYEAPDGALPPDGFAGLVPQQGGGPHPSAAALWPPPSVVHIGPSRRLDSSDFTPQSSTRSIDVGFDGVATRTVLSDLYLGHQDAVVEDIKKAVFDTLGIELAINEVSQSGVGGTVIQGRVPGRSPLLPLAELGTGLSHALPLIVQCAALAGAERSEDVRSLLVCEEPEAHLHPQTQAELADRFVELARSGRSACLVETHSETFVLRIRRRVAEGILRPDQVVFAFVDDEGTDTELRVLGMEEDGSIPEWPEEWFGCALDEVRAIHRARNSS